MIRRALLAVALLLAPGVAWAQREQGFVPEAPRVTAQTSPLVGTAAEPLVRLGQDLLDLGVLPRLRLVNSVAGNPVGGRTHAADDSGVLIFGADFDLARLAGVPGALLHVSFAQFYGRELSSDAIGARTKVQSYYYPNKQFELSELTYEQGFFGNRLNVLGGRANATGEFARSTYGCRFQDVADCPYELTQVVAGFPGFPYVNWGARVRVAPTPDSYVKAGAYELNGYRNRTNGFDFGVARSTGIVIPMEAGYGTSYADDPYPRHVKVGGWYNTASYTDPFLNARGRSRVAFGGTALSYQGGRGGMYALADQVVWRAEPDTARGVAVFGTVGGPFDAPELFAFQGVAGAIWTGPLAARPDDQIGFLLSFLRLSNKEDGYLNALLAKAGSRDRISRNEFIMELNYGIRALAGVIVQPDIQGLIHPDSINAPAGARRAPRAALVLGLKVVVNANEILGLPDQLPAAAR